ncbi:MAG: hypothetical protein KIS76_12365 [Pyrinomonadaceae bacterium]|nr:hypothetical protein [Pyrinomonadaceae bacterium]
MNLIAWVKRLEREHPPGAISDAEQHLLFIAFSDGKWFIISLGCIHPAHLTPGY